MYGPINQEAEDRMIKTMLSIKPKHLKEYKFKDLTKEEKKEVRILAKMSLYSRKSSWAEKGKENWDLEATLFKNNRIGRYGPIKL